MSDFKEKYQQQILFEEVDVTEKSKDQPLNENQLIFDNQDWQIDEEVDAFLPPINMTKQVMRLEDPKSLCISAGNDFRIPRRPVRTLQPEDGRAPDLGRQAHPGHRQH